jgi:hypothetical protein
VAEIFVASLGLADDILDYFYWRKLCGGRVAPIPVWQMFHAFFIKHTILSPNYSCTNKVNVSLNEANITFNLIIAAALYA